MVAFDWLDAALAQNGDVIVLVLLALALLFYMDGDNE